MLIELVIWSSPSVSVIVEPASEASKAIVSGWGVALARAIASRSEVRSSSLSTTSRLVVTTKLGASANKVLPSVAERTSRRSSDSSRRSLPDERFARVLQATSRRCHEERIGFPNTCSLRCWVEGVDFGAGVQRYRVGTSEFAPQRSRFGLASRRRLARPAFTLVPCPSGQSFLAAAEKIFLLPEGLEPVSEHRFAS